MAAEIFLPALTSCQLFQQVAHAQYQELDPNLPTEADHPSWTWDMNLKRKAHEGLVEEVINEDEDSWEVRAFTEDTTNNATWPPRSYTCHFCRREFGSAQALGGHMNVHRRDRARLHQYKNSKYCSTAAIIKANTSSPYVKIPPQDQCVANGGGLCFLYQLPNTNNDTAFTPMLMSNSSTTFLPIATHLSTNMVSIPQRNGILLDDQETTNTSRGGDSEAEGLDLELRLGH